MADVLANVYMADVLASVSVSDVLVSVSVSDVLVNVSVSDMLVSVSVSDVLVSLFMCWSVYLCLMCWSVYLWLMGAGIAQWLERRTRDRKGAGSTRLLERRENFLLQGPLSVLLFLFRYPFHPRVTAVARKRPRSFCQKRRWEVTAKHAYTLRI